MIIIVIIIVIIIIIIIIMISIIPAQHLSLPSRNFYQFYACRKNIDTLYMKANLNLFSGTNLLLCCNLGSLSYRRCSIFTF